MFRVLEGPGRELQAILSVYLSTLLSGYGTGFSAAAVPGIKEEARYLYNLLVRLELFIFPNMKFVPSTLLQARLFLRTQHN